MRWDKLDIAFRVGVIAFMASTTYCDIDQYNRIKALEKKNEMADRKEDHEKPLPRVDE